MSIPTIRASFQVPFPAQVQGLGAIKVTKANGIFSINFDPSLLTLDTAPNNSQLLVTYDPSTKFVRTASIASIIVAASYAQKSIGVAQSPYTPLITDNIILVDTSGGPVTVALTLAAARLSLPLTIKDVNGHALTNNISVTRSGAETIDGLATYPINADYGGITLIPVAGSGYAVAP